MNTMAQPLGPSSLPIIGRLVWKDTRRLAAFFVAMIALAVGIQCIITWTISNSSNDFGQFGGYTFAALGGFAALFAAACGATSFATEKEERTFDILQLLPLKSSQLLVGKLLAIIVLSLAFLLLMTLLARFWMPNVQKSWQPFLATFVVGTFEYFAWSLLFSVLLRSPLNAAIAGIFCASASSQIAVYFASGGMNIDYVSLEPYAFAWKTRLAIASVVFAVAVWKAKDWLSSSPTGTQTSDRQVSSNQSNAVENELSTCGFFANRHIGSSTLLAKQLVAGTSAAIMAKRPRELDRCQLGVLTDSRFSDPTLRVKLRNVVDRFDFGMHRRRICWGSCDLVRREPKPFREFILGNPRRVAEHCLVFASRTMGTSDCLASCGNCSGNIDCCLFPRHSDLQL